MNVRRCPYGVWEVDFEPSEIRYLAAPTSAGHGFGLLRLLRLRAPYPHLRAVLGLPVACPVAFENAAFLYSASSPPWISDRLRVHCDGSEISFGVAKKAGYGVPPKFVELLPGALDGIARIARATHRLVRPQFKLPGNRTKRVLTTGLTQLADSLILDDNIPIDDLLVEPWADSAVLVGVDVAAGAAGAAAGAAAGTAASAAAGTATFVEDF